MRIANKRGPEFYAGKLLRGVRRPQLWLMSVVLLLGLSSVALAAPDGIAATRLSLASPSNVLMGKAIALEARLTTEDGQPVAKGNILFYSSASFLSGGGLMRIGEAVTDGQGVAVLEYVSRRDGVNEIMAEFPGDNRYASSRGATEFSVAGNKQFYEADAGINVPLVSKWALAGFVGLVWGIIFYVVLLVVRVALAPPDEQ